ncbi:MAG TPA: tetratricopeptide repeat protein, partial [Ktedonobacteraceae bacterium]|nr:tetratricopeptide repeat protein [Ktedonobacteraceae bacterium]
AIQEQRLGPEHPEIVDTLNGYASLLRAVGRESEATSLEERAQTIPTEEARLRRAASPTQF